MRRTTTLTAASLLGLALLAPHQGATASTSIEFCAENVATIVGTSPTVTGTEGDDVIVAGASTDVRALGGDDVICVDAPGGSSRVVSVDAGDGDDQVLLETAGIGAGSLINTGKGEDLLVAAQRQGRLEVDLKWQRLRINGAPSTLAGPENAFVMAPEGSLTGTNSDNDLFFNGCEGTITGGHGSDRLTAIGDYVWESYVFDCESRITMHGGPKADRLRGSQGADDLHGDGGSDTIEGRGGDDRIRGGAGHDTLLGGRGRDDLRGEVGRDRLVGQAAADSLLGGRGRDTADGSKGRDRCVAERERRCER